MASDLIDRKEFIKRFCGEQCGCKREECGYEYVEDGHDACFIVEEIEKAQVVDAVEIVRCKDCANRGDFLECPLCVHDYNWSEEYQTMEHNFRDETEDDGFCHKGVKKDAVD